MHGQLSESLYIRKKKLSAYGVMESLEASRKLLEALWAMDEAAVAVGIEKAHDEISIKRLGSYRTTGQ